MQSVKLRTLQTLLACDKVEGRKVANQPAFGAIVDELTNYGATRVLTIGGFKLAPPTFSRLMFEFTASESKWTLASEISINEFHETDFNGLSWSSVRTTILNDGSALIAIPSILSREWSAMYIFHPRRSPRFTPMQYNDMTAAAKRNMTSVVTLHDGRVMFIGGTTNTPTGFHVDEAQKDVIFDMHKEGSRRWTEIAHNKDARLGVCAFVLEDGNVLIVGGRDVNSWTHGKCEIYDVAKGTYRDVASMHNRRQQHAGCLLPSGRVFICGGEFYNGDGYTVVSQSEEYDVDTNTWHVLPGTLMRQVGHKCVLLRDQRVLITGSRSVVDNTELYDYRTQTFTTGPQIPLPEGVESVEMFGVIPLYD